MREGCEVMISFLFRRNPGNKRNDKEIQFKTTLIMFI